MKVDLPEFEDQMVDCQISESPFSKEEILRQIALDSALRISQNLLTASDESIVETANKFLKFLTVDSE